MSPILGIWASGQQPPLNANSFESIATVTVGAGGSSTISFTSIPGTYKHLQIRAMARTNRATTNDYDRWTLNGNTGSVYWYHQLNGDGSSASAAAPASAVAFMPMSRFAANSATSGIFGVSVVDILDYTNTNKYRTLRALSGSDENGSGSIYLTSGWYPSSTAVTQIDITAGGGTAFNQYSTFALYGIKG